MINIVRRLVKEMILIDQGILPYLPGSDSIPGQYIQKNTR